MGNSIYRYCSGGYRKMTKMIIHWWNLKLKYAILRDKVKRKASLYRAKLMDLPYMLAQKETISRKDSL